MSRSVLVVDDDASFRDLATRLLVDSGYAVIGEAASVEEGLARTIELKPDTALVDIGLPDGDGFTLARALRAMQQPVRVVLVSSDGDLAHRRAAQRAGACGFLPKDELSASMLRQLIEGG